MKFLLIPAILAAAAFIWWRFFYVARPAVPPLSIAPDDPLMREAMSKAKESIPRFRELAAQPNRGVRVKIPFLSNSGQTEYLWAEVLSLRDSDMDVRYVTPPVTHTGTLERLHTHPVSDLVDWQVEFESGKLRGGLHHARNVRPWPRTMGQSPATVGGRGEEISTEGYGLRVCVVLRAPSDSSSPSSLPY